MDMKTLATLASQCDREADISTEFINRCRPRIMHGRRFLTFLTGSAVYGLHLPNDIDLLVLASKEEVDFLKSNGWKKGGSGDADETAKFVSLRYGDPLKACYKNVNLICSDKGQFLTDWISAHDECIETEPRDRRACVKIFRRHLYGEA